MTERIFFNDYSSIDHEKYNAIGYKFYVYAVFPEHWFKFHSYDTWKNWPIFAQILL